MNFAGWIKRGPRTAAIQGRIAPTKSSATILNSCSWFGRARVCNPSRAVDTPTYATGFIHACIFTFVMVSGHYLERSELESILRREVWHVDKALWLRLIAALRN